MNPVAATVMIGVAVAWSVALWLMIHFQYRFGLAFLALVTIAAFVRWDRLG